MNANLSLFHRASASVEKHLSYLRDNELGIYSESTFRELLILERKRTERSGIPFLLMLLDVNALVDHRYHKSTAALLKQAIGQSIRETDIAGWFEHETVIGIICMEAHVESADSIAEKFRTNLAASLDPEDAERVVISWFSFPDKTDNQGQDDVARSLYHSSSVAVPAEKISSAAKRAVDVIGGVFGMFFFAPFFILIPILIKATSKGPVFFRQNRVGLDGKPFSIFKFRTMYMNSDSKLHKDFVSQYIKGSAAPQKSGDSAVFKITDDPRITPVGRFLRKTSLDEIPQFINVLKGDMSLVGPRPAIPYEVGEYQAWHKRRVFEVKPGITGVWQVEGRSRTTFEGMVRMDIQYIRHCSVLLDLKLIFKTPLALFSAKGAY